MKIKLLIKNRVVHKAKRFNASKTDCFYCGGVRKTRAWYTDMWTACQRGQSYNYNASILWKNVTCKKCLKKRTK